MFELGQQSAARSEQAKLGKIAKPSYQWEAAKRPIPCGERKDSVCFEKRARMDLFAAVLPTPGYSSMYEIEFGLMGRVMHNVITVKYICMLVTNSFFYPQVKQKQCVNWAYAIILEFSTVANRRHIVTPRCSLGHSLCKIESAEHFSMEHLALTDPSY